MKPLCLAGILFLVGTSLSGADLPPIVREASQLELEGRLSEALDRYKAALASEPTLVQDEAVLQSGTVLVLSKAAHLSADLGYGEEAWDLGARLLSSKNPQAVRTGTLVRMRLLRLQGRNPEALALYEAFVQKYPKVALGPGLANEAALVAALAKKKTAVSTPVSGKSGPLAWVQKGNWDLLAGPTEILGLTIQESVRLQVGAFKDWSNALTLVDMLREKGWSPFTDVKTSASGNKLHVVYVVSRQPSADRARLEAQGLTALP